MPKYIAKKFSLEAREKMRQAKLKNPTRFWLGKKRSKETIEKVAASLRGKSSHMKGKKHTEETKKKISEFVKAHPVAYWKGKKREDMTGEKHPNWRGGVTPINLKIRNSLEMRLWREAVFTRDKYTCVWCGKVGGTLQADHIKQFAYYPELRFAIDNGRTLCKPCHKTTETYSKKLPKKLKSNFH